MDENNKTVRLGDGVTNKVKDNINENLAEVLMLLSNTIFNYIKDKIKDIPKEIEKILSSQEVKREIVEQWSAVLFEKGLIPKGYNGLSDEFLISNFRQEGYLDGLYAGYIIAMMSMADNGADKDLLFSVREAIRSNLLGNRYDNRNEFYNRYKEKYSWIESISKDM